MSETFESNSDLKQQKKLVIEYANWRINSSEIGGTGQ